MNRKVFILLVFLMGVSIVGIIAVQLVWMKNAIRVKNELFGRSVNDALNNTIEKLEKFHNLNIIQEVVFPDSTIISARHLNRFMIPPPPPIPGYEIRSNPLTKNDTKIIVRENIQDHSTGDVIHIRVDNNNKKVQSTYNYAYFKGDSGPYRNTVKGTRSMIVMNNDSVFYNTDSLILAGEAKINSIIAIINTFKIKKPNIKTRIRSRAMNLKHLTDKYVKGIALWDSKGYEKELIDSILKIELKNKDIPITYNFGIIENNLLNKTIPEIADSVKLLNSEFKVNLYPNDIFQKNIKLSIIFPSRDRFVFRSLSWLLIASLLFSIIILLTFAMSIFYLLRQKKISEMKSDFINNMTHEFKTPIATISVAADSINNDRVLGDPEKIRYFAGMIKKENSRMNRQVEDILTIARLEKKDFEFKWEKIDIHELIEDALLGISLQIEKKGGKINTDFKAAKSEITTDKIHCTNVLFNLFDNAIKYSSGPPEIIITSENTREGIIIAVDDKGIGMSKAVQAKIFERFYRQTSGNIHNVKGFGLGLSYSKAVIEANKGTISVQSEPGKGSKFSIFLPFERIGNHEQ